MGFASGFKTGYSIGTKMEEAEKRKKAEKEWEDLLNSTIDKDALKGNPVAQGVVKPGSEPLPPGTPAPVEDRAQPAPVEDRNPPPQPPAPGAAATAPGAAATGSPPMGATGPVPEQTPPITPKAGPAAGLTAKPTEREPFKVGSLEDAREKLYKMDMLAAKHPEMADRVKQFRDAYTAAAINKYQRNFKGDLSTPKGVSDYVQYMAKGAAEVGKVMSPEEAAKNYEFIKQMKQEGYDTALKKFQQGDFKGGVEAWNGSGQEKGEFIEYKPTTYNLAGVPVPGYEVTYKDAQGQTQKFNTAEKLFQAQAFENQVDMARKGAEFKEDKKDKDRRYKLDVQKAADQRRKVIQGAGDQYIVNTRTGEKQALGVGNKASGKAGAAGGKTPAQVLNEKKFARDEFQTSMGITDAMIDGLPPKQQLMYSRGIALIDKLVDKGMTGGQAQLIARKYKKAVEDLRKDGDKRAEQHALKVFEEKYLDGEPVKVEKPKAEKSPEKKLKAEEKPKKDGDYSSLWR